MLLHRAPGWERILRSEALRRLRRKHSDPWPVSEPLHPVETFDVRPAIYHRDHLQRVVKVGFDRPLASEKDKLDARKVRSTPPELTVFRDVIYCGGRLFGRDTNHFLAAGVPMPEAFMPRREYDHVAVTNSTLGLRYFGHWLRDDCAARELPLPETGTLKSLVRPDWPDCSFYESAFEQSWPEEKTFFAHRLSILTDIGFSLDKKRRLQILRQRLRRNTPAGQNAGGITYVRRGRKGMPRTMGNEEELMTRLSADGVKIVEAETSGETVARAMLDAQIIIGIEGSQLSHATYNLQDNGALLVIQPPDRFYNPHHEWARLLGMRYGTVVGHARPTGYVVDIDEVLDMIDRLKRALEQPA